MINLENGEIRLNPPTTGADAPSTSFAHLGLLDDLVHVLKKRNITQPLPIQACTIADALAGRDVSGKAPTGSGKTLAFALPMASTVHKATRGRPRGLVLAPTRELASQIAAEIAPLLACRGLRVQAFYGGVGFGAQLDALHKGVDVAVACPGRLEDLMGRGSVRLCDVEMVVVDEADRMVDMGFLPAVTRILDATPSTRQTLVFSATLDGEVDILTRRFQREPVRHEVTARDDELKRVTHEFRNVGLTDRLSHCTEVLESKGPTVVFVRTKRGADRLTTQLLRSGVSAAAIHGDRSQVQRERALAGFRRGITQVLVATDVAARGIHVDDIACVVHYDLPADSKEYVHRSGRTARAGASGSVVSFVLPGQEATAADLRKSLGIRSEGLDVAESRRRPEPKKSGDRNVPLRSRRRPRGRGRTGDGRVTTPRSGAGIR